MPSSHSIKRTTASRKFAYLLFAVPLSLPVVSMGLASNWGFTNLFAWSTVFLVFVIVPALDHLLGPDPANPDELTEVPSLNSQAYYRILTLTCVLAYTCLVIWAAWVFTWKDFDLMGQIGWICSVGTVGGLGITVAHELIHKESKLESRAGGLLLAMVCYGGFKVEHLRGHHVHVSTPKDASSARFDQSLYSFLPRAFWRNFINAWRLEAERLGGKGEAAFSWKNELIGWYGLSLVVILGLWLGFGWRAGAFFLGQSLFAVTLLETVNYLEHYGLHRRRLANGRYEATRPEHSWNSSFFLTNAILFQLQRHSDHHAHPRRRYQILRHYDQVPQLPSGYAGMILLALIPPLWRRIMNPRVLAWYEHEERQLLSYTGSS